MTGARKICPKCGTTLEEFRRTGLLGCAICYRAFAEEIMPTLRLVQGSVLHTGKHPAERSEERYSIRLEQQLLIDSIEQAMREGNYERAEELKERLQQSRGEDAK